MKLAGEITLERLEQEQVEKANRLANHPWRAGKADRIINSKRGGHQPDTTKPMSRLAAKEALRKMGFLVAFTQCGSVIDKVLVEGTGCGEYGGVINLYSADEQGNTTWCWKCGNRW